MDECIIWHKKHLKYGASSRSNKFIKHFLKGSVSGGESIDKHCASNTLRNKNAPAQWPQSQLLSKNLTFQKKPK